jgi:hypothetical protein
MQRTRPRLAHALVGVFALLVLGGIALSLSSAPPVDVQQLSIAAEATMTASGFALADTNSVTVVGPVPGAAGTGQPSRTVVIRVRYQAPDRVQESEAGPTGGTVSVIVIGSERFRSNGSQWTALPPQPGLGAQAARTITSPLQVAASATTVTRHGTVYQFVPRRLDQFLVTVLGVRPSQVSEPRLTAVVRGEYLTDERITAVLSQQRLEVDLAFSAIGSAPPVHAPPATSLVPSAGSGVPTP